MENILAGLDVAPVIGGMALTDDAGNKYVFKGFSVRAVDGKVSRYSTTRPASPEEIVTNAHLQERIARLDQFVTSPPGLPGPEFRPREYFDDLVAAEKSGLVPLFQEAGEE